METVAEKFGQEKPGIEHVRGFCRVLVRTKAKKKQAVASASCVWTLSQKKWSKKNCDPTEFILSCLSCMQYM